MNVFKKISDILEFYLYNRNVIGIGTGRTITSILEELKRSELMSNKLFVTTSLDSEIKLRDFGARVLSISGVSKVDIYIDSFDIYRQNEFLIKGGGGAFFREKLLASMSKENIFVGDEKKRIVSDKYYVPIEVIPSALTFALDTLRKEFKNVVLRSSSGKMGPVISDNGNVIIDVEISGEKICSAESELKKIIGVVETGIFCTQLIDKIILYNEFGHLEIIEKSRKGIKQSYST
ncbi:ribose-5-phosphate isomerase [Sulfolobales archaeon HS-7]|nr:ribose-5-phosphate isomerase [Sulfolobales archaeon HS-7]